MSGVATAIVGAAVVGAGAGIYSSNQASSAARHASGDAISEAQAARESALGQVAPFREAGLTALGPLTGLLTGNQYNTATGESETLTPEQRDKLYYNSPGYQYAVSQTEQSAARSQAARGMLLGPAGQKELSQNISGLASQNYNTYISQLQQLAGMGGNASVQQGNTINNAGNLISGYAQQGGLTASQNYINQGNIISGLANQSIGAAALYGYGRKTPNSFNSSNTNSSGSLNSSGLSSAFLDQGNSSINSNLNP